MQTQHPLHTKFLTYLEKNFEIFSTEQHKDLVGFAKNKLPDFLRTYFMPGFGELYEHTDYRFFRDVREKVPILPEAKAANDAARSQHMIVLKYYSAFLQSKTFKGKEKVVLTEKEKETKEKPGAKMPSSFHLKADLLQPEEDPSADLTEGKIRRENLTKHERNRTLRRLCLNHYGYTYQVCGMNFEHVYGALGKKFIEVHHLNPIAGTDGEHVLDPINGLVPLCPNCHSMIHLGSKKGKPMALDELKLFITVRYGRRNNTN